MPARKLCQALMIAVAGWAAAPGAARGDTIQLSFSGNSNYAGSSSPGFVDVGGGLFSAGAGTTSAAPSNFVLSRSLMDVGTGGTAVFSYPAADLTSFTATLTGGIVTGLSFTTASGSPVFSTTTFSPNAFAIVGGSNGTFTYKTTTSAGTFTEGSLRAVDLSTPSAAAATPLPKSATAGLSLLGLAGLTGLRGGRRRGGVATA